MGSEIQKPRKLKESDEDVAEEVHDDDMSDGYYIIVFNHAKN